MRMQVGPKVKVQSTLVTILICLSFSRSGKRRVVSNGRNTNKKSQTNLEKRFDKYQPNLGWELQI